MTTDPGAEWRSFTLDDVVDVIEVAAFVTGWKVKLPLLQVAVMRCNELMKSLGADRIADFAIVCHDPVFHRSGRWGVDSQLDELPPMPNHLYHAQRMAQWYAAATRKDFGWEPLLSAVTSVWSHYGVDAAINYLDRLWRDAWIVSATSFGWLRWMMVRAAMLGLDVPTFQEHVSQLSSADSDTRSHDTLHSTGMIARAAALTADPSMAREYHAAAMRIRQQCEDRVVTLKATSSTQATWLKGVRQLWPHYATALLLLAEAHVLSGAAERAEIAQEHRFVDERQADIRGVIWGRQHLVYMDDLHQCLAEQGARAARQACRLFQRGRVALPDGIFEWLIGRLSEENSVDWYHTAMIGVMMPYYASLSTGQEFATAVAWGVLPAQSLPSPVIARMLHEMAHALPCGPDKPDGRSTKE